MNKQKHKTLRRSRRRTGIRKRVVGTQERPRLSIYRSLNHMYAQIIDDLNGRTMISASSRDKDLSSSESTGNSTSAAAVGSKLAEKAKSAGITDVAFDRGGFKYHGRVKALAEAAREGGLKF